MTSSASIASRAQVLDLRNDPSLSREMTGHLLDADNRALGAAGLPQTPTNSYLAHFLGSGGATALLKAASGTPVSDVLGDDQIAANRSILAAKTVDDVTRWAGRKMGDSPEARLTAILPADQREVGLRHAEALYATQQRQAGPACAARGSQLWSVTTRSPARSSRIRAGAS